MIFWIGFALGVCWALAVIAAWSWMVDGTYETSNQESIPKEDA